MCDNIVLPLMALLFRIASRPVTKARLCTRMIACDHDRAIVLGRGVSLPHRLIKLSTQITMPELKQLAASLLFKLSNEDSRQLIANVGFGCGVGILQLVNMSLSPDDLETGQNGMGGFNPITGQRLDAEAADSQPDLPKMTKEEKEREAEKLFILFERSVSLHTQFVFFFCLYSL